MGYKTRGNYAPGFSMTEERFNEIFKKKINRGEMVFNKIIHNLNMMKYDLRDKTHSKFVNKGRWNIENEANIIYLKNFSNMFSYDKFSF